MVQLVSLDEIKAALRIDGGDEDGALTLLCEAASESVIAYLKAGANSFYDGAALIPGTEVPAPVKAAAIYWVGTLRRNPDNNTEGAFQIGFPPYPVASMLYPFRDPALA